MRKVRLIIRRLLDERHIRKFLLKISWREEMQYYK